jgi:ABC-type uncharacterized transport system ATPase subunit
MTDSNDKGETSPTKQSTVDLVALPKVATIQMLNLTRRFGALVAVDNLSHQIMLGDIFGLLGSNGAGKSTACPS